MTERVCVRGCTAIGDDGEEQAVEAAMGLLCRRCFDRLWWRLGDLPEVLEQAVAAVIPSTGSGERVSGTKDYDVLNDQALEDSDQLWSVLVAWGTWWASSTGIKPAAALSAPLDADRNVAGVSVRATPSQAGAEALAVVQWLRSHLESFAYQPVIADMHDEIIDLAVQLKGRYGLRERKHRYRRRPCTICVDGRIEVTWQSDELLIRCGHCWTEYEVPEGALDEIGVMA